MENKKQGTMRKGAYLWLALSIFVIMGISVSCGQAPIPCEGGDGKFTCQGLDNHEITLTDVPDGITPSLLYVSPERKQQLLDAPKEGTECIFMIAGDLDFYRDGELVTSFDSPITITYAFETQDLEAYSACQKTLVEKGIVGSVEEVDYLPVYFDNSVWKPFNPENVSIDSTTGTMTIKFTSWGDRPIGGGTQP